MMVVDTSAVVALMTGESGADLVAEALDRATGAVMSAATVVELGIVLEGRVARAPAGTGDHFLRDAGIEVVAVDRVQAERALEGWRRFGKGRHPAALNFGDCFTYALASTSGLPILCVGADFARTDVEVVPLPE